MLLERIHLTQPLRLLQFRQPLLDGRGSRSCPFLFAALYQQRNFSANTFAPGQGFANICDTASKKLFMQLG